MNYQNCCRQKLGLIYIFFSFNLHDLCLSTPSKNKQTSLISSLRLCGRSASPGLIQQAYALKLIYNMHPQTSTEANAQAYRVVRAQCKIRGAVNGGGQLGCCFIKVQWKCRSVSCRKQGIGSASFCLLDLKHTHIHTPQQGLVSLSQCTVTF